MLLRNVTDIVKADKSLLVDAVLQITDKRRLVESGVTLMDLEDAIVAVRCDGDLPGRPVLVAALSDAMKVLWE